MVFRKADLKHSHASVAEAVFKHSHASVACLAVGDAVAEAGQLCWVCHFIQVVEQKLHKQPEAATCRRHNIELSLN